MTGTRTLKSVLSSSFPLLTAILTVLNAFAAPVHQTGSAQPSASQAHSQHPLTLHVRDVTLNGQAPLVGLLPATQSMSLVLVLPLRNQDELDGVLKDLYDPSVSPYRGFLTVEEFTARFGPSQNDYDAVISFAEAHGLGVFGTSRNRMNVQVTGSVANIEEAFHLRLGVYQHPAENRTFYAPDREPTLDLPFQLWHISGLDNYSIPRPLFRRASFRVNPNATTGSGPGASFLGSDMRAAYYEGTALTGAGQSLGLLEFYGTDLADLATYFENVGQTNNVPIALLSTDGTSTNCLASAGCDDTEQTVDMTQAIGMAPELSSLVMYVGSTDSAILSAMATASPLNAQLSCSWTWAPADPSADNPYFEEFAAQGQNFFQAAGDNGAWGPSSEIFPADDVYVTSVGGTDLETSGAAGLWSSETAWIDGGGGISPDEFPIPSWQTAAASGCSSCSTTYRNGPDVSANANYTFYVCADQIGCTANVYGGASFAAPIWAGYLALANEQAIANGNNALGFLNPSLYAIGLGSSYDNDFHDITSGGNGYSAITGYDLATGWGSPNGSGLINALAGSSTPTTTAIVSSLNPALVGQSSVLTATVAPQSGTGTPAGTVIFEFGYGGVIGTAALSGGQANLSVTFDVASAKSIIAVYPGDTKLAASTSHALNLVVNQAATSTSIASLPNPSIAAQSVTLTATVSPQFGGTPTGIVTFKFGYGGIIGTAALSGGQASLISVFANPGTKSIIAVYSGDANFVGSASSAMTQVVTVPTTTSISSSPNPSIVGQPVMLTATVTPQSGAGTPSGTVTFEFGYRGIIGTATLSGGQANFASTFDVAGTKSIIAVYSGDASFAGSNSSTLSQVENPPAPTTTSIASSANPSTVAQLVTLAAAVTPQSGAGIPTGTVTFEFGYGGIIGTATLIAGQATLGDTFNVASTKSITAVYSGDANFAPSTSSILSQVVGN
jgi:subtilase family serine protease